MSNWLRFQSDTLHPLGPGYSPQDVVTHFQPNVPVSPTLCYKATHEITHGVRRMNERKLDHRDLRDSQSTELSIKWSAKFRCFDYNVDDWKTDLAIIVEAKRRGWSSRTWHPSFPESRALFPGWTIVWSPSAAKCPRLLRVEFFRHAHVRREKRCRPKRSTSSGTWIEPDRGRTHVEAEIPVVPRRRPRRIASRSLTSQCFVGWLPRRCIVDSDFSFENSRLVDDLSTRSRLGTILRSTLLRGSFYS